MIPKSVDTYLDLLNRYPGMEPEKQHDTVQWHILHDTSRERITSYSSRTNYSLINNLVAAIGTGNRQLLMEYLVKYDPAVAENMVLIEKLVTCSLNYYIDFIEPNKQYKKPDEVDTTMLSTLRTRLVEYTEDDPEIYQSMVFDIAREHNVEPAEFFKSIYQILLGQDRGPRFGTFTQLIGKDRMISLIDRRLNI